MTIETEQPKAELVQKNIAIRTSILIEHNFCSKQELEKESESYAHNKFKLLWDRDDWTDLISSWRVHGGGCVYCSGDVTSAVLNFYRFNVREVACYECQNRLAVTRRF